MTSSGGPRAAVPLRVGSVAWVQREREDRRLLEDLAHEPTREFDRFQARRMSVLVRKEPKLAPWLARAHHTPDDVLLKLVLADDHGYALRRDELRVGQVRLAVMHAPNASDATRAIAGLNLRTGLTAYGLTPQAARAAEAIESVWGSFHRRGLHELLTRVLALPADVQEVLVTLIADEKEYVGFIGRADGLTRYQRLRQLVRTARQL